MEKIYIYGAGTYGRFLLSILRRMDIGVDAFIDQDVKKQGVIDGIRCLSVEKARNEVKEDIVLISVYKDEGIEKELENCDFKAVYRLGKIISKLYGYFPQVLEDEDYKRASPFNRYDSPYPDVIEIHQNEERLFADRPIYDIDFNLDRQMELLKAFFAIPLLQWCNEPTGQLRYYYNNGYFHRGCAHVLYYMINVLKPKRIIEVGSGFSTAVMLDTNEHCFQNQIEIESIEPYPERLKKLLKQTDKVTLHEAKLQEIPVDVFERLEENDLLFIDSSHVVHFNSDVDYIFFEILPRLRKGVYIHFHDIFYPFIYPKAWIYEGRAYNEMYLLRAFLMNNENYKIQMFPDMLNKHNYIDCRELLGGGINNSIYLRKEK